MSTIASPVTDAIDRRSARGIGLFAVLIAVAVVLPFVNAPVLVGIDFQICILIVVAVSWNMMAGAGLISLGHSAFFGLGSYTAILMANRLGLGFGLSLAPAMAMGAVLGGGLALMTGRLRGIYFAIATLAASEGLRVMAVMLPDLTGGSNGIYLDSSLAPAPEVPQVAAPIAAIVAAAIAYALSRSRHHFALRAMRNSEMASQMLGVEPLRYRIGIMAISGALASLAGALSMCRGGYLDPAVAFDLLITIDAQIAPILGGIYTLSGPILGAIVATGLGEGTRILMGQIVGASLLVFGLVLILMILWMPDGIRGAWQKRVSRKSGLPQRHVRTEIGGRS